jgi:hypothetical protein
MNYGGTDLCFDHQQPTNCFGIERVCQWHVVKQRSPCVGHQGCWRTCMQLFDLLASTACPRAQHSAGRIKDASFNLLAIAACRKQRCAGETDEEARCKRQLTVAADYVHRVLQPGFLPGENLYDVDQVTLSRRLQLLMGRDKATCYDASFAFAL